MDSINGKLVIGKDTFLKNNDSYKYGGDPLTTISFTEDSVKINWYAWSGGAGHHSYTLHGHKN